MTHVPPLWQAPIFAAAEFAQYLQAPRDTMYRWQALAHAARLRFATKLGGQWRYSPHDKYMFSILAAMYRLGHGIGIAQIRAVFAFANTPTGPCEPIGPFVMPTNDGAAHISVDAVRIWNDIAGITTEVAANNPECAAAWDVV